jgi:hypothetical protein
MPPHTAGKWFDCTPPEVRNHHRSDAYILPEQTGAWELPSVLPKPSHRECLCPGSDVAPSISGADNNYHPHSSGCGSSSLSQKRQPHKKHKSWFSQAAVFLVRQTCNPCYNWQFHTKIRLFLLFCHSPPHNYSWCLIQTKNIASCFLNVLISYSLSNSNYYEI